MKPEHLKNLCMEKYKKLYKNNKFEVSAHKWNH